MGKRRREFINGGCNTIALFIVGCYFAYQSAGKIYYCSNAEQILVENTMQILDHSVCNDQRFVFQEYAGLNCDDLRKRLNPTDAGLRWWSCLFSSISILQSSTTWVAIGVCVYVVSLWMRYTNTGSVHHPPAYPHGQYMMLPAPPRLTVRRRKLPQITIEAESDSSSEDSSSVEVMLGE